MHHVGTERLLPAVGVVADGERADVAHQRIDAAELAAGGGDPGAERAAVSDVEGAAEGGNALALQCRDGGRHLVGVAGADRDCGAFAGEGLGDGATDALAGAGDDGAHSFQPEIHVDSPVGKRRF